jgi:DHA1 family tetracycline resistance protein-like MFS transporter
MNKAFVFIFLTVLIDVTGLGIIIPVLPELIKELTGSSLSDASSYAGWMAMTYSMMMFVCAPVMGGLSDQYGRRPVLLLSLFGFGLDYLLQGFAPNIFWLFTGRLLAGVTGASFSTAAAFISDLSTPEKKAQNFGMIGAAFGLGFIIGPLIGALLGTFGTRAPFFGAAALAFANLSFGYFTLPESLKQENRRKFSWKRANPMGTFRVLGWYPVLRKFVAVLFFMYLAHYSLQATWPFYTMHKFSWDHQEVGFSLAFVGLMMAIVQGGLTRILIPKLGPVRSIYVGMSIALISYLSYAFASAGYQMYIIMFVFSISGIAGPSIQGMVANQVPADAQGELQGGLTSLMSVTAIIGPLLMTQLFHLCTRPGQPFQFPGAPFFMAFLLVLVSLALVRKPIAVYLAGKDKS